MPDCLCIKAFINVEGDREVRHNQNIHSFDISIKMLRKNVNVISRVILGYGIIHKFVYFSANSNLADITPVI